LPERKIVLDSVTEAIEPKTTPAAGRLVVGRVLGLLIAAAVAVAKTSD
jgi:hypothetical protein